MINIDIKKTLKYFQIVNESGIMKGGEEYCQKLLKIAPNDIEVLLQCGHFRYNQRRFADAIHFLKKGFESNPNDPRIRKLLLACYKDSQDAENLIQLAHHLMDNPIDDDELALAYTSLLNLCDWHHAKKIERRVLHAAKGGSINKGLLPGLLLTINGAPNISTKLMFQIHQRWGKQWSQNKKSKPPKKIQGRIRIAYISSDYYRHPVGFFMLDIIEKHHREEFEIFCYSHMLNPHDEVTDMFIKKSDHFIDISNMNSEALLQQAHQDGIHIAIDLSSHTGHSRTATFAQHLAPIQISYLGYPNTTGLKEMDFHITDHFAEDIKNGTKYSEELLFMPKSFLCYGMEWNVEKKKTAPCEDVGYITFASFNDRRKLNLDVIKVWADILHQVEHSRLLLKFIGTESPIICNYVYEAFAEFHIDKDRIVMLKRTVTEADHMLYYHQVDIALDPFPYTGTTTTCEALSQGVPVVTLVGSRHSQRVSYSILKNIGFEETITYSEQAYIEKAVQLAKNPSGLSVLRGCLPLLLQYSPLRDSEQFVCDLENLYKEACRKKKIKLELYDNRHEVKEVVKTRKLHIGGKERHPDWEIFDAIPSELTDHIGNANDLSAFEDQTFDAIYTSHVLEHFSYHEELTLVLNEWYRVLKPGGILYASVPDLEVLCELFLMKESLPIQDRFMVMRMIFGGQIDAYDFHKVGYNEEILSSFLSNAGFKNIEKHMSFGLFNDTSEMIFQNKAISLNLTAVK